MFSNRIITSIATISSLNFKNSRSRGFKLFFTMKRSNLRQRTTKPENLIANKINNKEENKNGIIANGLPEIVDQNKTKQKLNFDNLSRNLRKLKKAPEPLEKKMEPVKKKLRAKVDLKMMEEELKQLEDPAVTPEDKKLTANRLTYDFFNTPCEELAQNLLGKILVRKLNNGTILKGRIVETESYLGGIDKASQTYQNKVTPRNIPMYMLPGTIYVYFTYGMYYCFNISSQGEGAAVLLRGVEPLEGIEAMINNRISKLKSNNKTEKNSKLLKTHEVCNGPSKLCIAYDINRDHNKYSMCGWKGMWLEDDPHPPEGQIKIVKCARIGIDSAGPEWASKPLRYYIFGNTSVSKRDKKAEASQITDE